MSQQPSEKHRRLSDPALTFAGKLKLAATYELEYWEDRGDPPNIPITSFRSLVQLVPDTATPVWRPRTSAAGAHGATGEDHVFNFEFDVQAIGQAIRFYCKGYFFDKGDLKGVTIQSFRPVPRAPVIPFKR